MVNIEILVGIIAIAVIGAVFIPLAFDPPVTSLGGGNVTIIETMPIGIQHLFGHWDTVRTFIPIGTTFTDVFDPVGSQGKPVLINTTEFTEVRLVVQMEQIALGAPSINFNEKDDGHEFNNCTICTFDFQSNGMGANRILIVEIAQSSDGFPTNVTYATEQLTLATSSFFVNGTLNNPIESSIWYLVDPAIGDNELKTFFNSTQDPSTIIMPSTYTGVDQLNPINAVGGSFGEASTPTVQITTTIDNAMTIHMVTVALQPLPLSERIARPISTDSNNGWTITGAPTHHEAIDEAVPNNDTDFIESDVDDERVRFSLSPLQDPLSNADHKLRVTAIALNSTGGAMVEILDAELYQGAVLKGTALKTVTRDEWKKIEFKFGNPQITDYTDLHIEIASNMNGTAGEIIRVTQMEFETPVPNVQIKKNEPLSGKERFIELKIDDITAAAGDKEELNFGTFTRGWDIEEQGNPFIANFTMSIVALEPLAGGAFGNQTIRLVDQNGVDVIVLIDFLLTGKNDSGFVAIPSILNDTSKFYKLQLKSTVVQDQITFLQGLVYLR